LPHLGYNGVISEIRNNGIKKNTGMLKIFLKPLNESSLCLLEVISSPAKRKML
jgi:hypothetical protein